MGVGSLLAALSAGLAMARLAPRLLLFFGPASSTAAAALLLAAPHWGGFAPAAAAYLMLGFGPILWLVCQNTIRQIVTPHGMLGRVGAVIQLAIYGVRSLGALLGGAVAVRYGAEAALGLVLALFAASTLVIPLSALGRLRAMPQAPSPLAPSPNTAGSPA
jgi:predicted MFS family arabinose efflux permease